jgi:hypothetical protein
MYTSENGVECMETRTPDTLKKALHRLSKIAVSSSLNPNLFKIVIELIKKIGSDNAKTKTRTAEVEKLMAGWDSPHPVVCDEQILGRKLNEFECFSSTTQNKFVYADIEIVNDLIEHTEEELIEERFSQKSRNEIKKFLAPFRLSLKK